MSAGGCYCLQMWALGNHKTQSLWSIPEPLPLYIAFSSSTHNLSPFLSSSLTHTHILSFFSLYFPSLLCLCHSSSLSSIFYTHTHSISVFYYILLLSVVCLCSLDIFLVSSLFFPCSLTRCPQAWDSSTRCSSPAFLPLFSLQYFHPCAPPPLLLFCPPSHVCTLSEGEYWLHAWLTGTVMDDLQCVCVWLGV